MLITVNGMIGDYDEETSVSQLCQSLDLPASGTAVAVNGSVVLKNNHESTSLKDGDVVEIIRAVAGG